jgi:hypothetical protein
MLRRGGRNEAVPFRRTAATTEPQADANSFHGIGGNVIESMIIPSKAAGDRDGENVNCSGLTIRKPKPY